MKDEFKLDIAFECKEIEEDPNYFIFEGMGSTSDLDLYDDIVEPTAFTESIKKRTPALIWQHDTAEPVGVYTLVKVVSEGLKVAGKMPLADDFVRGRVVPQMRVGAVKSLSIGFRAIETEYNTETGCRTIQKLELFEISLVTIPANPHATIQQMKSYLSEHNGKREERKVNSREKLPSSFAEKTYRWEESEAKKRVRAWAGAEDESKYKSAFIYFDSGSTKCLVADVIDEELKVIPRAVFAIRAALSGAKGGVDIPEEDKKEVKKIVNKLYEDMCLDPPFDEGKEKAYCLTEIKNLSKSCIAYILRYKNMSKDAARYVTDLVNSGNAEEIPGVAEVTNILDDILKNVKGV